MELKIIEGHIKLLRIINGLIKEEEKKLSHNKAEEYSRELLNIETMYDMIHANLLIFGVKYEIEEDFLCLNLDGEKNKVAISNIKHFLPDGQIKEFLGETSSPKVEEESKVKNFNAKSEAVYETKDNIAAEKETEETKEDISESEEINKSSDNEEAHAISDDVYSLERNDMTMISKSIKVTTQKGTFNATVIAMPLKAGFKNKKAVARVEINGEERAKILSYGKFSVFKFDGFSLMIKTAYDKEGRFNMTFDLPPEETEARTAIEECFTFFGGTLGHLKISDGGHTIHFMPVSGVNKTNDRNGCTEFIYVDEYYENGEKRRKVMSSKSDNSLTINGKKIRFMVRWNGSRVYAAAEEVL